MFKNRYWYSHYTVLWPFINKLVLLDFFSLTQLKNNTWSYLMQSSCDLVNYKACICSPIITRFSYEVLTEGLQIVEQINQCAEKISEYLEEKLWAAQWITATALLFNFFTKLLRITLISADRQHESLYHKDINYKASDVAILLIHTLLHRKKFTC
jgi:hypothetical protein